MVSLRCLLSSVLAITIYVNRHDIIYEMWSASGEVEMEFEAALGTVALQH
jgi:hypothetical protein